MGLISRRTTRWVWLLLAAAAVAAAADGALWLRDQRRNAQIASASVPADQAGLPPPMQFAQAHALAASGAAHGAVLPDDVPLRVGRAHGAPRIIPAPTVELVPSSMRMKLPVVRLRRYSS